MWPASASISTVLASTAAVSAWSSRTSAATFFTSRSAAAWRASISCRRSTIPSSCWEMSDGPNSRSPRARASSVPCVCFACAAISSRSAESSCPCTSLSRSSACSMCSRSSLRPRAWALRSCSRRCRSESNSARRRRSVARMLAAARASTACTISASSLSQPSSHVFTQLSKSRAGVAMSGSAPLRATRTTRDVGAPSSDSVECDHRHQRQRSAGQG